MVVFKSGSPHLAMQCTEDTHFLFHSSGICPEITVAQLTCAQNAPKELKQITISFTLVSEQAT